MTYHAVLFFTAATHDHGVGTLIVAGLVALGGDPPGRDRMAAPRGPALAAAMGVIDRVHDHPADGRSLPAPAFGARLTQLAQAVLGVADLADHGAAFGKDLTHLPGTHAQRGMPTFTGDELGRVAARPGQLCALTRTHLNAVHQGTQGDIAQRQAIARTDGYVFSRLYAIAAFQTLGGNDVGVLSVQILEQGQVGAAIGVVFDPLDDGGNTFFVAFKIDHPITLLVSATAMAHGDATLVVTPTGPAFFLQQRTERLAFVDLRCHHLDHKAPPWGRRICLYDSHSTLSHLG